MQFFWYNPHPKEEIPIQPTLSNKNYCIRVYQYLRLDTLRPNKKYVK